jgi:hypothetical protein
MEHFYFDIADGQRRTLDEIGTVLPGREQARDTALTALPDLAREGPQLGDRREIIVDVRNATRRLIFTATLTVVGRWLN